jgi:hypothetical protein
MSRHKIVKNLDLDDELDEFDGGGGDDYYAYESNGYDGGGGGGIEGILNTVCSNEYRMVLT